MVRSGNGPTNNKAGSKLLMHGPIAMGLGKFVIGTAQFGMPYGIANESGATDRYEAQKILSIACQAGFSGIDTAEAYGKSIHTLGSLNLYDLEIFSKTGVASNLDLPIDRQIINNVKTSLSTLRREYLDVLLIHDASLLNGVCRNEIYEALRCLKVEGLVKKIGVSGYRVAEVDAIIKSFSLDVVQFPFNVFDQRLTKTKSLEHWKSVGIEVHVRSIYLQGLLLMEPGARPDYFIKWSEWFFRWDQWVKDSGNSRLSACLGFVLANPMIDRIVLGFASADEVSSLLEAVDSLSFEGTPDHLFCADEDLIFPFNWRVGR
jgi:aryl-alcohol dehydrogenase-like predicted oxidoreductase